MKKSALLITILIILSSISAYAQNYTKLFGYTEVLPQRGSASLDISFENMKEFEFLTALKGTFEPFDIKSIAESILDSKIHIDISYRTQQNNKIAKIYAKAYADAPLLLSNDLKITANAVFHIWADYNFTSENSPYYRILIKSPIDGKFYMLESTAADSIKIYPSEKRNQKLKYAFENALRGNSGLIENDGEYTLTLNDSELKNTLKTLTSQHYNTLFLFFNGKNSDRSNYNGYMQEIKKALDRLETIQILGNRGIKLGFKFSKNSMLEKLSAELDIDTNIFKLYYASTGKAMPADPNAAKPVINAYNSDISLKIKADAVFKTNYINFKTPSPSSEEIVDLYRDKEYSLTYTTNDVYISPYEIILFKYTGLTKNFNGVPYIPLRSMMNALGLSDDLILWQNNHTEITGNIFVPFQRVQIFENSQTVYADGNEVLLSSPVMTESGTLFVPEDFVTKIIDAGVLDYTTSYYKDYGDYYTTVRIERIKPIYYSKLKGSENSLNIGIYNFEN